MNIERGMNEDFPKKQEKLEQIPARQKKTGFDRRMLVLTLWIKLWKL